MSLEVAPNFAQAVAAAIQMVFEGVPVPFSEPRKGKLRAGPLLPNFILWKPGL
jgi:hypothetical protein